MALYVGEGSEREQSHLLGSWLAFSQFSRYPQANWALLVLIPGWVDSCMFQDPMGLSNQLSCEAGSFFCCLNSHRFFYSQRFWGFISPRWNPELSGLSCSPDVPSSLSAHKCGTARSTSRHLTVSPLCPGCWSPPLLPIWMNVSSLIPWLSDFHVVQFSGCAGCFLFLNLLLSSFWLCKEAKCV